MWTHEASIETTASPAQVWRLFSDVPGWKRWNAGIENIAIDGPFEAGTTFAMQPPGSESFHSTLLEVTEDVCFTDETEIDGTRVVVCHAIEALGPGRTRVSYSTRITGPAEAAFGPMVTDDFPEVLSALKRELEQSR